MMAMNRPDEGGRTASIRITVILTACGGAPLLVEERAKQDPISG